MLRAATLPDGTPWLDLHLQDPADLEALARAHGLHRTSVQDCLEPGHPAKVERIGEVLFVVARCFDPEAGAGESVEALTHKVAVFLTPTAAITVHRAALKSLDAVWAAVAEGQGPGGPLWLLSALLAESLRSFEAPLEAAEGALERRERDLFRRRSSDAALLRLHAAKRRLRVLRRTLWRMLLVVQELRPAYEEAQPHWTDLKERAERTLAYADELDEEAKALLNLELSAAAQRTNEVMRILTLFSVFFLPLNFIVGLYGMNFPHMPLLERRYGYASVWIIMVGVVAGVFLWFRRKGWLK